MNNKLFFADNMLHPSILATNNILTADNLTVLKKIQTLQASQIKLAGGSKSDVQDVTNKLYKIKEVGALGQWKLLKKGAWYTFSWFDTICDFFEKIRNLIRWEDEKMTEMFLFVLIVLFLVVSFLPMRAIFHLVLVYKFIKKKSWQRKRVENNEEICKIELKNFIKETKLGNFVKDQGYN
jgi:hypothetical protein